MTVWAIVVAAGSGTRFGGAKQYEALGPRRVLDWSVLAARTVADGVVLVVPEERAADAEPDVDAVVPGGPSRSESVRAGLTVVPDDVDVVVVHDAARPLVGAALFAAVVAAVATDGGADGAVPALPVTDTIKQVRDGTVVTTLDRSALVSVQTPQAFRASMLRTAHAGGGEATDDAALVEAVGGRVVIVPGAAANMKLTSGDDLRAARRWLDDPAATP